MELLLLVWRQYRWPFISVMALSLASAALGIGLIAFINQRLIETVDTTLMVLPEFLGLLLLLMAVTLGSQLALTALEKRGLLGRHKLVNPETGELKTLTPWRLRTIYQTNLQSAFMAGRYAQMQAATDSHPYWQYVAIMDSRTRPAHAALNGRTFRHDDPVWSAGFFPPLGYNCRCRARPMSEAAVKREGIALSSSQGRLSQIDVEVGRGALARPAKVARFETGPNQYVATDPGFAHSPADASEWLEESRKQRLEAFQQQVGRK